MTAWIWVDERTVIALHDEQIAEHGGQPGIRDQSLLDFALARPVNRSLYDAGASIAELAAAYGYGIARNHPFFDGNKRTALVVTELFLGLNGFVLIADDPACLEAFLALADGSLSEEDLTRWIDANLAPME